MSVWGKFGNLAEGYWKNLALAEARNLTSQGAKFGWNVMAGQARWKQAGAAVSGALAGARHWAWDGANSVQRATRIGTVAAAGATAGYMLSNRDRRRGAIIAGIGGVALSSRGRALASNAGSKGWKAASSFMHHGEGFTMSGGI